MKIETSVRVVILLFATVFFRAGTTWSQPSRPVPVPADILDPPWLESRRQEQLATADQFQVFHDFTFTDRLEQSGIRFRHRVCERWIREGRDPDYVLKRLREAWFDPELCRRWDRVIRREIRRTP